MKDLIFIIIAFLLIGIQKGDPPQQPKNFADPKWNCPLAFGDWPETFDCLPEKSE